MTIEEIDRNFTCTGNLPEDLRWYSVKESPFSLHGLVYDTEEACYRRLLPKSVTREFPQPNIEWLTHATSGGRIRFTTDAYRISIKCLSAAGGLLPNMPLTGTHGFALTEDTGLYLGKAVCDVTSVSTTEPFAFAAQFFAGINDGKPHTYTLWFPLYHGVKEVFIGLPEGASLSEPTPYKNEKPVVFYGSSITQGGCASRPGNDYAALLSEWCDTDYVNLGFSGNARGELPIAEHIATLDPSVFVFDYDYNSCSVEHLASTHEAFFLAFRKTRPDTPVIFMSKPNFDPNNREYAARRRVIEQTYENALARGDKNVFIIKAEIFYGTPGGQHCTVDYVHPNDLGFYRMAEAIYPILSKLLK
ncbi:MAG: hypothetical protein J6S44_00590 [Clostridia bacterium]|nr:hypothetical protein [Clostridia bacterium]